MSHRRFVLVLLFAVSLCALAERGEADSDLLPTPRKLFDGDDHAFSTTEFDRMLSNLKAEREGLNSDWQAMRKRKTAQTPTLEAEQKRLEMQMQKAIENLRRRGLTSAPPPAPKLDIKEKKTEADATQAKKADKTNPSVELKTAKSSGPLDPLARAHTLMRSRQFEEALATFQQVDLKGKKVNERAPVQYLKACCLLHLGQSKEAAELLQEVANHRGDERLAGYAQWQLEMLRWHRDIAQRLQDVRERHQALEKRP